MAFRAKFKVTASNWESSQPPARTLLLRATEDGNGAENGLFSQRPPRASLAITVDDPAALKAMFPGQCFYLDFTEVSESGNSAGAMDSEHTPSAP